jgi:hypothetical protein
VGLPDRRLRASGHRAVGTPGPCDGRASGLDRQLRARPALPEPTATGDVPAGPGAPGQLIPVLCRWSQFVTRANLIPGISWPSGTRSVVSHQPSPPLLLPPSRPRWCWSTAISLVSVGRRSPPVTHRMVAIWSQFRAGAAGPGVWHQVALGATLSPDHRFFIWCLEELRPHNGAVTSS